MFFCKINNGKIEEMKTKTRTFLVRLYRMQMYSSSDLNIYLIGIFQFNFDDHFQGISSFSLSIIQSRDIHTRIKIMFF
jgi:hypothetical protein